MPVLPFPEYRPDVSDFNGQSTATLLNVIPRSDGYGPVKDATAITGALPDNPRGLFMARRNDQTLAIFAGTDDKLYLLDNTTLEWTDVSKAAGTYSPLATAANWSFVQFNQKVIATQANDVMQVYDVETDSAFSDLGGSPPQAAFLAIVNRFLVASNINGEPRRVQWSGLNAITTWTSGTTYSDSQDLPDGGAVQRVVGGEYGLIIQEQAVRRMTFTPGSDIIFQFDRLATDVGTFAPWSVVESNGLVYCLSLKGFVRLTSDGGITPIGHERVDRTFLAIADQAKHGLIQAVSDPANNLILWTYHETSYAGDRFNKALVYNAQLNRWSPIELVGTMIGSIGRPGLTLEALGAINGIDITGAADNGAGLIRLTVDDTTGWTTGDIKDVHEVGGTTEANGTWTVTVIDGTHIDLQASTFSNAYTSGGYVAGAIDDLDTSLDDYSNASLNNLGMFNADAELSYFTGSNKEATLTTSEQSGIGKRLFVRGLYPITDATAGYCSVGARESLKVAASFSTETEINTQGFCPQRVSTRHARAKLRIPASETWTFAGGVEPDVVYEGRR